MVESLASQYFTHLLVDRHLLPQYVPAVDLDRAGGVKSRIGLPWGGPSTLDREQTGAGTTAG